MNKCIFVVLMFSVFLLPISAENFLKDVEISDFLPQETLAVVAVNNLEDLSNRLGKQELSEKYKKGYENIVSEITQQLGANIFTAEGCSELGIDVQKPFGAAFLSVEKESYCYFGHLTDVTKFENFITQKLPFAITSEKVGNANILYCEQNEKMVFVLMGDYFVVCFVDSPPYYGETLSIAKSIASRTKEDSLSMNTTYQETISGLGFGDDVAVYVDIQSFFKFLPLGGQMNHFTKSTALGLGFDFGSDQIEFKGFLSSNKESAQLSFLKNINALDLLYSLNDSPLFFTSIGMDTTAILDYVKTMVPEEEIIKMEDELMPFLQGSLESFLTAFTGQIEVAIVGNMDVASSNTDNFYQNFDFSVAIGITNRDKIHNLLSTLAESQMIPLPIEINKETNVFTILAEKAVSIKVTDRHIIVSTSHNTLNNLTSRSFAQTTSYQLSKLSKQIMVMSVSPKFLGYYILVQSLSSPGTDKSTSSAVADFKSASESSIVVPYSEEYLAKQQEIEELRDAKYKKIDELEDLRNQEINIVRLEMDEIAENYSLEKSQDVMKIIKRFGNLTFVVKKKQNGLLGHGSMTVNSANMKALVEHTVEDSIATTQRDHEYYIEVEKSWDKRDKVYEDFRMQETKVVEEYEQKETALTAELEAIRQKDIEAYHKEK